MSLLNFYREADDDISTSDEEAFDINQLNEQERMKLASQTRQESLQPTPVGFRNVEMNEALAKAASQLSPGTREENVQRQNIFRFRGTSADEREDTTETSIADTIKEDRAAAGIGSQTEGGDIDVGSMMSDDQSNIATAMNSGYNMKDLAKALVPGMSVAAIAKVLGMTTSAAIKMGIGAQMSLPVIAKLIAKGVGRGVQTSAENYSIQDKMSSMGMTGSSERGKAALSELKSLQESGHTMPKGMQTMNLSPDVQSFYENNPEEFKNQYPDMYAKLEGSQLFDAANFRKDAGFFSNISSMMKSPAFKQQQQDQFAAGQQQDIATARGMSVEESQLLDQQLSESGGQAAPSGMESPESYSEFSGYGYGDDYDGGWSGGYGGGTDSEGYGTG